MPHTLSLNSLTEMNGIDYILKEFKYLKEIKVDIEHRVEQLNSKLESLEKSLFDLHETIKSNQNLLNSHDTVTFGSKMSYEVAMRNFPKTYRKDTKIKWIVEKYFEKGVRLSDISEAIDKFNGQPLKIDNVIRRLKKDGVLVLVKYNNSNKLGFWGLSDWVDEKGFKEKFQPSKSELPLTIKSVEIIKK